jgi:hypothetical protein
LICSFFIGQAGDEDIAINVSLGSGEHNVATGPALRAQHRLICKRQPTPAFSAPVWRLFDMQDTGARTTRHQPPDRETALLVRRDLTARVKLL